MDESENNRGRKVVARRQQHQQGTLFGSFANNTAPPDNYSKTGHQHRAKSKVADFMVGVAAGLSATNNTSSASVLPKHLEFRFRDRIDASAKGRFQVKVPCRLMTILAVVFLIFPCLIFLHKERHIHDGHYQYHFKPEHYANVDTKDVWENFRLAITEVTEEEAVVVAEAAENPNQQKTEIDQVVNDSSAATASDVSGPLVEESAVVAQNNANYHISMPVEVDQHDQDATGSEISKEESNEHELHHEYESSPELESSTSGEGHPDASVAAISTPNPHNPTVIVESNNEMNGNIDNGVTKTHANSTATAANNESKR